MGNYYKARDSAVTVLRKRGIAKADYNKHLKDAGKLGWEIVEPKELPVVTTGIDMSKKIKTVRNPPMTDDALAGAAVNTEKKPKAAKPPKEPKAPRVSVSSVMRALILEGLDNVAVFQKAKETFPDLDDSKKSYPAWYRSTMRRAGEIQ